jgi:replicative DNA helicase
MKPTTTTRPTRGARYLTGSDLLRRWRNDVLTGTGPVLYRHAFPYPEIGPGLVTLVGGAPSSGKTALVTQMVIEMLRFQPDLRVLVANCEMFPEVLMDRQLSRLSGIDAEVVRHRRFGPEHEERLAAGLATIESVIDRLTFMESPYDIGNVAASADACQANVVILDYVQRFSVSGDDAEARVRVNEMMNYLRQFASAGIAVIVVSAVGRTRDKAGRSSYVGDGLSLASFRETSELEYGADDAVILAPVNPDEPEIVRLSHLKARHGRRVTQEFRFDGAVQSFTLLSSDAGVGSSASMGPASTTGATTPAATTEELRRLWDAQAAAEDDAPAPGAIDGGVDE